MDRSRKRVLRVLVDGLVAKKGPWKCCRSTALGKRETEGSDPVRGQQRLVREALHRSPQYVTVNVMAVFSQNK